MALLVSGCAGDVGTSESQGEEAYVDDGVQEGADDGTEEDVAEAVDGLTGPLCLGTAPGKYCGQGGQVQGGATGSLYTCPGANKAPTAAVACSIECVVAPVGRNDFCGSTLRATSGNVTTLQGAGWSASSYGSYDGVGAVGYGPFIPLSLLSVPAGYVKAPVAQGTTFKATRVYDPANPYSPKGQCVDLAKAVSNRTSATTTWVKGAAALGASLPAGTIVATFDTSGNYSGHVGVLAGSTATSIVLWDSNWSLDGLVKWHTIYSTGSGLGDARKYFVVKAP
jgi:hypothetical protein